MPPLLFLLMYITDQEYSDYTGNDAGEATNYRIKRASRLLDVRIGYYPYEDDWKLDVDSLSGRQEDAVRSWVAYMVLALTETNGSPQIEESVSLGRFSVDSNDEDGVKLIPDKLKYSDMMLKDSGLIRRSIPTQR